LSIKYSDEEGTIELPKSIGAPPQHLALPAPKRKTRVDFSKL